MPKQVQIDILTSSGGQISATGSVAQKLLAANFDVAALRTNAVLRKDEWILFDEALVEIARQRLRAVTDLQAAGLTMDLPNALGVTRLEWEKVSDMEPAEISMSGVKEGEADRLDFTLDSLPIPIVHKDFHVNIRALTASRTLGVPLDTAQVTMATRLVSEKIEDMFYNGAVVSATNGTIYGYLNAPNRNTASLTASWATATGVQMITDVLAMQAALQGDNMYGPYGIYISYAYWNQILDDYKAESDRTILERIMAIENISWIRPSNNMTGDNVIMFQLSSDVVRAVMGMQPTVIEWESHGGMVTNFKVMAIIVPQFRSDASNQSGVAHFT